MPPRVEVDTDNLLHKFHSGFDEYDDIWEEILTQFVYKKLLEIRSLTKKEFDFPTDLWARVLFDFAVAYHRPTIDRDITMDSLIPLYFGRTLSFVKKTGRMSIRQAEETIEDDCMAFEMAKPYLLQRWRGKNPLPD
jgi:hypothetical protein